MFRGAAPSTSSRSQPFWWTKLHCFGVISKSFWWAPGEWIRSFAPVVHIILGLTREKLLCNQIPLIRFSLIKEGFWETDRWRFLHPPYWSLRELVELSAMLSSHKIFRTAHYCFRTANHSGSNNMIGCRLIDLNGSQAHRIIILWRLPYLCSSPTWHCCLHSKGGSN